MDKLNLDFFLNNQIQIDLYSFLVSLFCASILSLFIQLFYVNFSSTLSNRIHFSKNFVILGVTTCIIIMIVKNSLALSLGLVGALSIVRFRAAIKEPEELVYLSFVIGIGLANGANQFFISTIATFITLLILYLRKIYNDKKNNQNISESSTNILQIQIANENKNSEQIIEDLKKDVNYLNLKSFSAESGMKQYNFWFDVNKDNLNNLTREIEKITSKDKDIKIQIYSRSGIYE
jgi:CBS-domain-containing membrane protein